MSPADRDFRFKEAGYITDKIAESGVEDFMMLGDFNAHSPYDADQDLANDHLINKVRESDKSNQKHNNLLDGEFDHSVMASFLSLPMIDVTQRFVQAHTRFTFPAKALIGVWQTEEEVKKNQHRLDYILTSRSMARNCIGASVFNQEDTAYLSDHYPVMATFLIQP